MVVETVIGCVVLVGVAVDHPGVFDGPPPTDFEAVSGDQLDLYDAGACTYIGTVRKSDMKATIDAFAEMPDEPRDATERRIRSVLNPMLFGRRPLIAVVLSDGRCSVNDPVGTLFFYPVTLFFIRGSVLPSVGLPHSQHPFVRRVSDVPVSHGRIPRA